MNEKKRRPQFFYEVGQGKLAIEAQKVYEKIQQLALESKQAITMSLKISVAPPPDGGVFGRTQFSVTHSQPVSKSILFTTEYEAGTAMTEGESVEAILQMNFLPGIIPESQRV